MKLLGGRLLRWRSRLREPYRIAGGDFDELVNLLVQVRCEGGVRGHGCAAPAPEVTGETVEAAAAALRRALRRLPGKVLQAAPGDLGSVARTAEACFGDESATTPAARCALECALLDAVTSACGEPLVRWLGGRPRPVPTSVTIGICDRGETLRRADAYVRAGFAALKIKGGSDVEEDLHRLRALRARLGPGVALRFDANAGYDLPDALRWARGAADLGVECLEQPLPRDLDEALPELRRRLHAGATDHPPLLMADESACTVRDAERLLRTEAVDALNVKLMKCGGPAAARSITRRAAAAGIRVMFSCMDELALGIAPALHLALATEPVPLLDLDGHLDVVDDPTAGVLELRHGRLVTRDRPGTGLAGDELVFPNGANDTV